MAGMRASIELAAKKRGFLVFNEFKSQLGKVSDESARTRKELQQLNRRTAEVQQQMRSAAASVRNFFLGFGAGLGLAEVTKEILRVGQAVDGLKSSFTATFGQQQVAAELDYIRRVSHDLGLEMLSTGEAYAMWVASAKGTVLEGQAQKQIFEAVAQASRILNLSMDDTNGTLRALSQMISKGKVQAEELRGQLGERLPGAFQMAAKAMGVSTTELDKMLQQGKVLAADLLPKLAIELDKAYGGDARTAAVQSLAAETNRLKNSLTELSLAIYKAIEPQLAEWARTATAAATYLADNLYLVEGAAIAVATIMAGKVVSSLATAVIAQAKLMAAEQAATAQSARTAWVHQTAAAATAKAEAEKAAAVVRSAQLSKTLAAQEVQLATTMAKTATSLKAQQVAMDQLTAAKARQAAANQALIKSQKNANIAQAAYVQSAGMAQKAAAAMGTANQKAGILAGVASKAVKGLGMAVSFLGGPIGIAIAAISALIYYFDDLKKYAEDSGIADRFAAEFQHIARSWTDAFETMPEKAKEAASESVAEVKEETRKIEETKTVWSKIAEASKTAWSDIKNDAVMSVDFTRQVFTYLPQYWQATIDSVASIFKSWYYDFKADLAMIDAAFQNSGAIIITAMTDAFAGIASAGGKSFGLILQGLSKLVTGFSVLGHIPGFEEFGAGADKLSANLRKMAAEAGKSGEKVRAAMASKAAAMHAAAAESTVAAKQYKAYAVESEKAAHVVWDSTMKTIAKAEADRIAALKAQESARAAKKLAEQQKQQKAGQVLLKQSTDELARSLTNNTNETKKSSESQKAAKKAAEELAKAQERIAGLFTSTAQKHDVLTRTLQAGEIAGRALELQYQNMHKGVKLLSDAEALELAQREANNKSIESQIQKREAAAKAIKEAVEAEQESVQALDIARQSIHMTDEQLRTLVLTHTDGYNKALAESQARNEALVKSYKEQRTAIASAKKAVEESRQSLEIAQKALGKTDEELNALTLSYKQGYTKALAEAQAKNETQIKSLQELRQAQQVASEAVKDAEKALKLAEASMGKTDQQVRELELSLTKGYTPALAAAQSAMEAKTKATEELRAAQIAAQKALEDTAKKLKIAEQALHLTDQGVRELELSLTKGYTPAQAKAQAADEARIKTLNELRSAQQAARKAVDESSEALEIAQKAINMTDQELRTLTLSYQKGYNPTLAATQAANEAQAKSLETVRSGLQELQKAQELHAIKMTEGSAAAEIAKLKMDGYSEAQAANKVATEENMKFQQAFYDTLVDSIKNAESVKDVFKGIGDFLKNWLKDQIAHFAANKIMAYVGIGQSGGMTGGGLFGSFQRMFGSGGSANGIVGAPVTGNTGGFGNMLSTIQGGGLMGNLMAGGLGFGFGQMIGQSGTGTGIGAGIGNMILPGIGGLVGGALGGLVESLFGGGPQEVTGRFGSFGETVQTERSISNDRRDERIFYQSGRSDRHFWRESIFGQFGILHEGSQSLGRDDDQQIPAIHAALDAIAAIDTALAGLIPDTEEGAVAIQAIRDGLDGFSMDALNTSDLIRRRVVTVYQNMAVGVRQALQGIDGGLFRQDMKAIAARIEYVGTVAANVQPVVESLGLKISERWDFALRDTVLLTDAMGGLEPALQQLTFYAQEFVPAGELVNQALDNTTTSVYKWNDSLGMGGSTLDVAQSALNRYTTSLDLSTTAGQLALEQVQAFTTGIDSATGTVQINRAALDQYIASLDTSTAAGQEAYDSAMALAEVIGVTGGAAITSREQFYEYIQSLDLTTKEGRKAAAAALEQMEAILALEAAHQQARLTLDTVSDAARNLNLNFDATSPYALDAAQSLVELMGGLEAFTQATNNYYELFYSQQEQQQLALAQSADAVSQFNDMLGLSGAAAIDTATEFRAYVESLDLTTEEGRQAYAAAMDVASAMAAVAESGMSLDQLIDSLPENLLSAFELMSGGSQSTAKKMGAAANDIDAATDVAGSSLNELGGAITRVANAASSAANTAAQAASSASRAAADVATAAHSTRRAAADASASTDGSHVSGLASVPFDGYLAELHAGEIVVPADIAESLRAIAKLPKFAAGGITSQASIAGEAGAEAVIPLPDGRTVPVTLTYDGITAASNAQTSSNDADVNKAYADAIKAAEDYAYELRHGSEALRERQLIEQGWTQQMIDNLRELEEVNKAAEKAAQVQSDYEAAIKAAEDYAYELKHGSEALRERQLIEQGWTQQMIDNLRELEEANAEAVRAIEAAAEAEQAAIDAMNVQRESEIETYKRLQAAAKDMRATLDDLFYNEELTLASPLERLEEARATVNELAETAARNPDDAEALSSAVTRALELSREFNASSQAYVDDYESMTGILDRIATKIEAMPDPRISRGSSFSTTDGYLRRSDGLLFGPGINDGRWVDTGELATAPRFAQGGITSGISIAGEAGPEAVIPLPDGRTVPVTLSLANEDFPNVIDARPVFSQQHSNENKLIRENIELQKRNAELQKQVIGLLKELRDDQREIGGDAHQQREEQRAAQVESKQEIRQLRDDQRVKTRFEEVA